MVSGGELGSRASSALKRGLIGLVPPLIAVAFAFIVGALVLQVTGYDPVEAYSALMRGAFGDVYAVGQTLSRATPIIFTALAFLFAMRCGLFNIGAEGQLIVGALGSALAGIYLSGLPPVVHVSLALLAGALVGGLWGLIPAVLKAYFGAHEVITTMMLSYVAEYLTGYMVNYPFKAPGWVAQTVPIAATSQLPRILQPTQLSAAVFIAVALAALTQFLLHNTTMGYEIRAIGLNMTAAENAGISVKRGVLIALLISGAMAGLGGSGEVLGVHRRFIEGFSPGYGWDGLAVALVGGLHPIGVVLAAVLFGALRSGGMMMTRATGVPLDIVLLLQALVIVFVSAPMLIRLLLRRVGYRW
jgi:simple sugar transport system permease protein